MKSRRAWSWGALVAAVVFWVEPPPSSFAQVSFQRLKSFGFTERLSGVCSEGAMIEGADGGLYGTTYTGGSAGRGAVFRLNKDGTGQTLLRSFLGPGVDGANPRAGLVQGKDGALYGTTFSGGSNDAFGAVFKLNTDGSSYVLLKSFSRAAGEGAYPMAGLVQATNGLLYGTTCYGGTSNRGTVFVLNPDGTGFSYLHSFSGAAGDGAYPGSTLIEGKDGALYGTTLAGGATQGGVVFRLELDGSGYATLHSFAGGATDGAEPLGALTQAADGTLYGVSFQGGVANKGTVFRLAPDGTGFLVIYSFSGSGQDGAYPAAGVALGSADVLYGTTMSGGDFANGILFSLNVDGTGFTNLQGYFGGGEGLPQALILGSDGNLYGTAVNDGNDNNGEVFSFRLSDSTYSVLEKFSGTDADGAAPYAGLIQGGDGALYGTASTGGAYGQGIVFRMNRDGTRYAVLRDFQGTNGDGSGPRAPVIQGSDGALYGTTASGGPGALSGTLFKLGTDGDGYEVIQAFSGAAGEGTQPTGLVQADSGALYGTTYSGGASGDGTAFQLNPDGTGFAYLHSFTGAGGDGANPYPPLIKASDGAFYGTTVNGGAQAGGSVFRVTTNGNVTNFAGLPAIGGNTSNAPLGSLVQASDGFLYGSSADAGPAQAGSLFKVGLDGSGFTNFYQFSGLAGADSNPVGGLAEGIDGLLYGTASTGGVNGGGTVFSVGKDGTGYTTLQAFTAAGANGADPQAALLATTDGLFFGTTVSGGDANHGTVFVLSATAPTNDSFRQRIVLPGAPTLALGNNFNATAEAGELPHGDTTSPATNSVWWSWQSGSAGPVSILTDGSSFNTIIDVYNGTSVSGLTPLASTTGASGSAISDRLHFSVNGGVTCQIAISGTNSGFINLSIQMVTLAPSNVNQILNADGSTSFGASIEVANSSEVTSQPLRVRLVARAGYSTLEGSPDAGLLPTDQELAIYNLTSPGTVAPGTSLALPVSVVCPPPIVIDPQKIGFGWRVFALLEEQAGTNWFLRDKDLLGDGLWPTIGGFIGPGGGVIRINPATTGSSFNPVSLTNVSIIGPASVTAGSIAQFYGLASFDDGSADYFTNTTWTVTPSTLGTIGTNGQFQAANLTADTNGTIGCYYFYDATNTAGHTVQLHGLTAPTITSQPTNQTADIGATVTFDATAGGSPPLSFQWLFGGTNVPGGTLASLTLSNVQPTQAGDYRVVVANAINSATSAVARLTVRVPPDLLLGLSGVTASTVSLTLGSLSGLTYTLEYKQSLDDPTWTLISPAVSGTGLPITLRDTNAPFLPTRFYRVRVE